MVYRIFVEKKEGLDVEAKKLLSDIKSVLGAKDVTRIRIFNRYDAENITRELFDDSVSTVFSEPQTDIATESISLPDAKVFAVEYLPGQYDMRADSAAQCIQIISKGTRPIIRTAKIYAIYGGVSDETVNMIRNYVINPVESREASLELPETLVVNYVTPTEVDTVKGFIGLDEKGLAGMIKDLGLAMDLKDLEFCQEYFRSENRDPTITEIRMIDTYWSDHCRHTTFLTRIDSVEFADDELKKAYEDYLAIRKELGIKKPVCLMDIATIGTKYLKKQGVLDKLDESEEINACSIKCEIEVDGKKEPWLLMFKNETHNHPTEIEPFGGAATCIGGAIRDPLSGRSYIYGAMRVTGAADPTVPIEETIKGKLPQRKITTTAADGYSSYGNQIGIATGLVDEVYHPGYAAKRMEIGAVIAAVPECNVRRERPEPGDIIILLGGKTGRDGCGGATGSSKSHTVDSLHECGAEVQKGNAPEERKLQRMFRNPEVARMIKRCNDFGAGGVSVAIGELADGLEVDLNRVPKKYDGLDGTELAISESQERMAVVIASSDLERFMKYADDENLLATHVATVTDSNRLVMRWNGKAIVDISRDFLNSNGAEKHIDIIAPSVSLSDDETPSSFAQGIKDLVSDLNICSKQGLSERFDSTIGAGSVMMPFGGVNQKSPVQAMVHKFPCEKSYTDDVSMMAYGFDPILSEKSQYYGAYYAVVESVSKLIASGADFKDIYLSFQEYFEHPGNNGKRWGKPLASLLGALRAQLDYGVASIGGKDSMSGSFEDLDVPPTLVSFAVTTGKAAETVSPDFKRAGNKVVLLEAERSGMIPDRDSLRSLFRRIHELEKDGTVVSCRTLGMGGIAEAVFKLAIGNGFGFRFDPSLSVGKIFEKNYGAFVAELSKDTDLPHTVIGEVTSDERMTYGSESVEMSDLSDRYEGKLEKVFPRKVRGNEGEAETLTYTGPVIRSAAVKTAKPKVLIPVFPGTNCEYDSVKAIENAGAVTETIIINNLSKDGISRSIETFAEKIKESNIIFIPGGFSGGDEPDGSGKFITAFFRNDEIKENVNDLLEKRDGLMCGICNGFQALIKLGLVPFGRITDAQSDSPTLTFNTIGRHQSKIVRTRIVSNRSPWLAMTEPGEIYNVPISHGEGRFIADENMIKALALNGQIATQYVDLDGKATYNVEYNPNGSMYSVEGITSPDGRVFGKMGHSERIGNNLYRNVPGNYDIRLFESAVKYFK